MDPAGVRASSSSSAASVEENSNQNHLAAEESEGEAEYLRVAKEIGVRPNKYVSHLLQHPQIAHSLTVLQLSHAYLGEKGTVCFSQCMGLFTSLRALGLGSNGIENASVKVLCAAINHRCSTLFEGVVAPLAILDLSGNSGITRLGGQEILSLVGKCKSLCMVGAEGTRMTDYFSTRIERHCKAHREALVRSLEDEADLADLQAALAEAKESRTLLAQRSLSRPPSAVGSTLDEGQQQREDEEEEGNQIIAQLHEDPRMRGHASLPVSRASFSLPNMRSRSVASSHHNDPNENSISGGATTLPSSYHPGGTTTTTTTSVTTPNRSGATSAAAGGVLSPELSIARPLSTSIGLADLALVSSVGSPLPLHGVTAPPGSSPSRSHSRPGTEVSGGVGLATHVQNTGAGASPTMGIPVAHSTTPGLGQVSFANQGYAGGGQRTSIASPSLPRSQSQHSGGGGGGYQSRSVSVSENNMSNGGSRSGGGGVFPSSETPISDSGRQSGRPESRFTMGMAANYDEAWEVDFDDDAVLPERPGAPSLRESILHSTTPNFERVEATEESSGAYSIAHMPDRSRTVFGYRTPTPFGFHSNGNTCPDSLVESVFKLVEEYEPKDIELPTKLLFPGKLEYAPAVHAPDCFLFPERPKEKLPSISLEELLRKIEEQDDFEEDEEKMPSHTGIPSCTTTTAGSKSDPNAVATPTRGLMNSAHSQHPSDTEFTLVRGVPDDEEDDEDGSSGDDGANDDNTEGSMRDSQVSPRNQLPPVVQPSTPSLVENNGHNTTSNNNNNSSGSGSTTRSAVQQQQQQLAVDNARASGMYWNFFETIHHGNTGGTATEGQQHPIPAPPLQPHPSTATLPSTSSSASISPPSSRAPVSSSYVEPSLTGVHDSLVRSSTRYASTMGTGPLGRDAPTSRSVSRLGGGDKDDDDDNPSSSSRGSTYSPHEINSLSELEASPFWSLSKPIGKTQIQNYCASHNLDVKAVSIERSKPPALENRDYLLRQVIRHSRTESLTAGCLNDAGTLLATASYDMTCKVWNVDTGKKLLTLEGHTEYVSDCCWNSPKCDRIITVSYDYTARIWDASTGKQLKLLRGHNAEIVALACSEDGTLLSTGGVDDICVLWKVETGEQLHVCAGHEAEVVALHFNPAGTILASGSMDETVRLWNTSDGSLIRTLSGHEGEICTVKFNCHGNVLISASVDETCRLWDVATGNFKALRGHSRSVSDCCFSPDGWLCASASEDGTGRVWDVLSGGCLGMLVGHDQSSNLCRITFNKTGQQLITGATDRTAMVWDVATSQCQQVLRGHKGIVIVQYNAASDQVMTMSKDNVCKIWKLEPPPNTLLHRTAEAICQHPTLYSEILSSGEAPPAVIALLERIQKKMVTSGTKELPRQAASSPTFEQMSGGAAAGAGSDSFNNSDSRNTSALAHRSGSALGGLLPPQSQQQNTNIITTTGGTTTNTTTTAGGGGGGMMDPLDYSHNSQMIGFGGVMQVTQGGSLNSSSTATTLQQYHQGPRGSSTSTTLNVTLGELNHLVPPVESAVTPQRGDETRGGGGGEHGGPENEATSPAPSSIATQSTPAHDSYQYMSPDGNNTSTGGGIIGTTSTASPSTTRRRLSTGEEEDGSSPIGRSSAGVSPIRNPFDE